MAYIVFADTITEGVDQAAEYFRTKGHRVVLVTEGREAEKLVEEEVPDVLVAARMMRNSGAYELVEVLQRNHPSNCTGVILLTVLDPLGEPARHWPRLFHSYVMRHGDPWQIILSVEQFLYMRVSPRE